MHDDVLGPQQGLPLRGVRVVELGMWVSAPAAAGVLADWGADVVKVEPPTGDPCRRFYELAVGFPTPDCPPFDMDNRGKSSVVLDVRESTDRQQLIDMLAEADVFVTNLRLAVLRSVGLDPETILQDRPSLVYALVTGHGSGGPDADRAAYDGGAFWARSGLARAVAPVGTTPPTLRPAVGDHITAMNLVAGVGAALFARERTGAGQLVETSLLRSGLYCLSTDLTQQMRWGAVNDTPPRSAAPNPVMNTYVARGGDWFVLLGLEADRHWPKLVAAIDRPELESDPRFASAADRFMHAAELVAILDEVFAASSLEHWSALFDLHDVWWAPMPTVADVTIDPQVIASGAFIGVPEGSATPGHIAIASPIDFAGRTPTPSRGVPALGDNQN